MGQSERDLLVRGGVVCLTIGCLLLATREEVARRYWFYYSVKRHSMWPISSYSSVNRSVYDEVYPWLREEARELADASKVRTTALSILFLVAGAMFLVSRLLGKRNASSLQGVQNALRLFNRPGKRGVIFIVIGCVILLISECIIMAGGGQGYARALQNEFCGIWGSVRMEPLRREAYWYFWVLRRSLVSTFDLVGTVFLVLGIVSVTLRRLRQGLTEQATQQTQ